RSFFSFAISTHLVGVGLHAHQIDDSRQILFTSDRKLQWRHRTSECIRQRIHHALRVRALAIHTADDDHARQIDLVAVVAHPLCDNLHSSDAIDHDERGIDYGQNHLRLVDKHVESGSIEQIELRLSPLDYTYTG